jgi:hypothetical protein
LVRLAGSACRAQRSLHLPPERIKESGQGTVIVISCRLSVYRQPITGFQFDRADALVVKGRTGSSFESFPNEKEHKMEKYNPAPNPPRTGDVLGWIFYIIRYFFWAMINPMHW